MATWSAVVAVVALVGLAMVAQLDEGLSALFPRVVSILVASDANDTAVPADPAQEACERVPSGLGLIPQAINRREADRPQAATPSPGIVRAPPP